jgi:hypothetical protein
VFGVAFFGLGFGLDGTQAGLVHPHRARLAVELKKHLDLAFFVHGVRAAGLAHHQGFALVDVDGDFFAVQQAVEERRCGQQATHR